MRKKTRKKKIHTNSGDSMANTFYLRDKDDGEAIQLIRRYTQLVRVVTGVSKYSMTSAGRDFILNKMPEAIERLEEQAKMRRKF
jgi:hypothetical protein